MPLEKKVVLARTRKQKAISKEKNANPVASIEICTRI